MGKYQPSKRDKVPECVVVFLNINNALYLLTYSSNIINLNSINLNTNDLILVVADYIRRYCGWR